jgi:hypothetical protein
MPVVDNSQRESRRVSFAPDLVDSREEVPLQQEDQEQHQQITSTTEAETESIDNEESFDDGTGKRFCISFEEHCLRFDQKFPKGLDLRIPESEYEIVLDQIHRDLIKSVEKSQKSVRKWSVLVAGTAPVGVGFALSIVLARLVNKHQKALKNFWLLLRNHLKALNRDIYYARGIEWRIEKDTKKIAEREAYNKLLSFCIEISFRKPITSRLGREVALQSVTEPARASSNLRSSIFSANRSSLRFSDNYLTDPTLFALLATEPRGEEYSYSRMLEVDDDNAAGVGAVNLTNDTIEEEEETNDDREIYSSSFLIPDHVVIADSSEHEEENLLVKVDEPADVAQARASSVFEPPSLTPAGSIFTDFSAASDETTDEESKRMTFADLLRSSVEEDDLKSETESSIPAPASVPPVIESEKMTFADLLRLNIKEDKKAGAEESNATGIAVTAGAAAAAVAAASLNRSPSPNETTPELTSAPIPYTSTRQSRQEAFAQRQRKKFSRDQMTVAHLYDIPESPKLGFDDDAAGDAMAYLNELEEEDLIDDIILGNRGVSIIPENFEPKPVVNSHFEDLGEVPVAAYPMADPFSPLYETDKVIPVDPPIETDKDLEYTDVDGEVEYVRRKKWRVDPERADKLSRVKTMSESIHPSSRRSSYLPVTRTTNMPSTINFNFDQND